MRLSRRRSARRRRGLRVVLAAAALAGASIVSFSTTAALTAGNSVGTSRAVKDERAIGANALKPADCAALNLTGVYAGSNVTSPAGDQLVLGTAGADQLTLGGPGASCIVGGAGADVVDATAGTAVCVISSAATETGCTTVVRRP